MCQRGHEDRYAGEHDPGQAEDIGKRGAPAAPGP